MSALVACHGLAPLVTVVAVSFMWLFWTVVTLAAASKACIPTVQEGFASYYARRFEGKTTASGTRYTGKTMVAAHPRYPFGTVVRVTNLQNGRSVQLRVRDRGPARGPRNAGVIIDLSHAAANILGFPGRGRARVRVDVLRCGP